MNAGFYDGHAKRLGIPYVLPTGPTAFDGNWKDQKLSESEYQQTFTAAESAYSKMLTALLDQLTKKKAGS